MAFFVDGRVRPARVGIAVRTPGPAGGGAYGYGVLRLRGAIRSCESSRFAQDDRAFSREAGKSKGKPSVGAMTKKKTKGKAAKKTGKAAKKAAKKRAPRSRNTKGKKSDPEQVRQDIAGMVKSGARGITKAVMARATNGCLARTKYLFEMAGIYPAATDGTQATQDEDCLAKTLLDRLTPPRAEQKGAESETGSGSAGEDEDEAEETDGEAGAEPEVKAGDGESEGCGE